MTASKPVPLRTCIACRQVKPKWELVRLVRTPQGGIEIDHRGKRSGRGAYLCKSQTCWELGLKQNRKDRLAHALKVKLTPEQRAWLLEYGKHLSNERGTG